MVEDRQSEKKKVEKALWESSDEWKGWKILNNNMSDIAVLVQ